MDFSQASFSLHAGKALGFLLGYALFTTVLFFALSLLHKLPDTWTYLSIACITACISVVGALLKRWLS